jgi:formylglycine-generating enzyme required for sulfatase activity
MKHHTPVLVLALAAAFIARADAQVPSVSGVTISQGTSSRAVTVTYTLADAPAIITLDITTNGVSIGQQNVWAIDGDANKVVQPGARSLVWHPDKSWPNQKFVASDGIEVGAVVTAWATNNPPMYLAADLVSGDVKYYTCAEAVPGGVQDVLYKTTSILMRRIYACGKAFMMGSPTDEPGRWKTDARETQHEVSFSHDYYMGVYEVTQQQWAQIMSAWPSDHKNDTCKATRPVENISWAQIRGASTFYPAAPLSDSFLALLRAKTGNALSFDLPGAAQWEYACKAGNGDYKWGDGTALDSGLKGTNSTDNEDPAYNALGRNAYNNATGEYKADNSEGALSTKDVNADTTCGTAAVGSYRPNSWGLYDMHGNVYEPCQDAYPNNNTNPYLEEPATSSNASRTRKGGSFQRGPFRHRASYQLSWNGSAVQDTGIRLAITLP